MALRVVDRMRGSRWQSALPTGSKWVQAQPAGNADKNLPENLWEIEEFGNSNLWFPISSPEPAVASGCRPCLPAANGTGPCPAGVPVGETRFLFDMFCGS